MASHPFFVCDWIWTAQSVDQAGFRKGFSCKDHIFTVVQLIERMSEYNCPLWIYAIDFRKAFDSVKHAAIWESLVEHGVHQIYIDLLTEAVVLAAIWQDRPPS